MGETFETFEPNSKSGTRKLTFDDASRIALTSVTDPTQLDDANPRSAVSGQTVGAKPMGYMGDWEDAAFEKVRKTLDNMFAEVGEDTPTATEYSFRLMRRCLVSQAIDRCLENGWSRHELLETVEELCFEHPVTEREREMQEERELQFKDSVELTSAGNAFRRAIEDAKRVGAPRRVLLAAIEQLFELPKQEAQEVIERRRVVDEANKVANEARQKAFDDYMKQNEAAE
jgi:hypothetical protein